MEQVVGARVSGMLRMLGIAVFAVLAWLALSLLASPSTAHADDGLLGVVSDTGSAAGDTLGTVVEVADDTAAPVVQTVTPAAAPVVEAVPEPVRAPVAQVATGTVETTQTVVSTADQTVGGTVDVVTTGVSDLASSGVVGAVVTPVVELVEAVPVVGDIVADTGLGDTVVDTADAVDGTVETVVGTAPPTEPLLPSLPIGTITPIVDKLEPGTAPSAPVLPADGSPAELPDSPVVVPAASDLISTVVEAKTELTAEASILSLLRARLADAAAISVTPPSVDASSEAPAVDESAALAALGDALPGSASASGANALGASLAGTIDAGASRAAAASSLLHDVDDALPGAPVYDTDVAPD